jgi:hypothetical protein
MYIPQKLGQLLTMDQIQNIVLRHYWFTPGQENLFVQLDEATSRMYDVCKDKTARQTIRFIWRRNEIARQMTKQ